MLKTRRNFVDYFMHAELERINYLSEQYKILILEHLAPVPDCFKAGLKSAKCHMQVIS